MQTRNSNNISIIDVSHHQGEINWRKVSDSTVKRAYVKATDGVGYVDQRLRENVV